MNGREPELRMAEISVKDLLDVVESVWTLTLGFEALTRISPRSAPAQSTWCGCVRVTGAWNGLVKLSTSEALMRRAAAAMFAAPAESLFYTDLVDALGELTNMTGGNVKALLPGPSRLSLAYVATNAHFSVIAPGGVVLREVAFQSVASQIRVQVVEV